MNAKKILILSAVIGILFLGGCTVTPYYGGMGYYRGTTYSYGYQPSIYSNYGYRYQPLYYGNQSYIGGSTYYNSGKTVIGVEGIGMVDISTSIEDIDILEVGINTSMADTAAVAIEEVIIVDDLGRLENPRRFQSFLRLYPIITSWTK